MQIAGSEASVLYDAPHIVIGRFPFPGFHSFPVGFRGIIDALIEQDHAYQFSVSRPGFHEVFAYNIAETVVFTGLVQNIAGQRTEYVIRIFRVSADQICVDPAFRRGVVEKLAEGDRTSCSPLSVYVVVIIHKRCVDHASVK